MPDLNDAGVIEEIIDILNKKPEERAKADINVLLPLVMNLDIFKEMNVTDQFNIHRDKKRTCHTCNNLKVSIEDKKFICKHMKFRFHKAGEHIIDYNEFGAEFFILLKGKAAVIVPQKRIKGIKLQDCG